jgi:hypothetical protein
LVPWLALLPGLVAVAHAVLSGRWLGVVLVVATILAQGAAVTSLGIALAIWVPRLDRALTLSAAAAVFFIIAWIPLMALLFNRNQQLAMGMVSASPLFGVGLCTSEMVIAPPAGWDRRVAWAAFWVVASSAASLALLAAALASFDACLGRIRSRAPRRPGRSCGLSTPRVHRLTVERPGI